tara:strand:- start:3282 stop:3569 length:288 start_codon:yes stop_codon:yes gene_type:complete
MNFLQILFAYINMVVPTPCEEWELHHANTKEVGGGDNHYLIVHTSGKWYEKIVDNNGRPIYISNSESYRYRISWEQDKPIVKYKAPNSWKWVKLN